jgi:hypothetical protein
MCILPALSSKIIYARMLPVVCYAGYPQGRCDILWCAERIKDVPMEIPGILTVKYEL